MIEPKMNLRQALALAIKSVRKSRKLTQEDFALVSSRTYLSTLERGLKSPTLDKLDEIAQVMKVHPAALVLVTYAITAGRGNAETTLTVVTEEARAVLAELKESGLRP